MQSDRGEVQWGTVLVSVMSGVAIVVLGQLAVRLLLSQSGAKISVVVEYAPVLYPPAILRELDAAKDDLRKEQLRLFSFRQNLDAAIHAPRIESDLLGQGVNPSIAGKAAESISTALRSVTQDFLMPNDSTPWIWFATGITDNGIPARYPWLSKHLWPKGFFRIAVTNSGGDLASSVSIQVPDANYASVERPGKQSEANAVNEVIEVGDLRPDSVG